MRQAKQLNPQNGPFNAPNELFVLLVHSPSQNIEDVLNILRQDGLGVRPRFADGDDELLEALQERVWDLLLIHPHGDDMDIPEVCTLIREHQPHCPIIVVADDNPDRYLETTLSAGAADVVTRANAAHLRLVVQRELSGLHCYRERVRWAERAEEAERRCFALLYSSHEAIAYVHEGMHIYANEVYLQMFGYQDRPDELESLPLLDLLAGDRAKELRNIMRTVARDRGKAHAVAGLLGVHSDDTTFPLSVTLAPATYDGEHCIQVTALNLSEKVDYRRELQYLRLRDPATGLFNQYYFQEQLERFSKIVQQPGFQCGVLIIELESFDDIRRTVGIIRSNDVVRHIGMVLQGQLTEADQLARIADRDFSVLLPRCSLTEAKAVAERLRAAVAEQVWQQAGHHVTTTCAIGVACLNADNADPTSVMAQADMGMHKALNEGGNQICTMAVEQNMTQVQLPYTNNLTLDGLNLAMQAGRAELLFQPIINLFGDSVEIYEVLTVIRDNQGQPYPTDEVFKLINQVGDPGKMDLWVVQHSIAQLQQQQAELKDYQPRLFIKLSGPTLADDTALLELVRTISGAHLPPGALTLEVRCYDAVRQTKFARAAVSVLHQAGCQVAMSHFGAELSDFNVLDHVDVDYLMYGPGVLDGIATDINAQQHIDALQQRAQALGKETIATAVQDATTLTLLWQSSVSYAQGYYIQEPSRVLACRFNEMET